MKTVVETTKFAKVVWLDCRQYVPQKFITKQGPIIPNYRLFHIIYGTQLSRKQKCFTEKSTDIYHYSSYALNYESNYW